MTSTQQRPRRDTMLSVLVLALLSASSWWAWLAWDNSYYKDPSTGQYAGPYMPWQVIGCVVSLIVIAALAYTRLRPLVVGATMTLAFTTAYALTVAPSDESGLSGVGVLMVLIGLAFATSVAGLVVGSVRQSLTRSRRGSLG